MSQQIQHQDLSFQSTQQPSAKIHAEGWVPNTIKAVVFVIHGYGEHLGRYAHVIDALAQSGYAVYALDHRGHGRSDGLRAYITDFNVPIRDLKTFVDTVRQTHPEKPFFMLGHSMGALISLGYVVEYPQDMIGLVTSGLPLMPDANVPKPVIKIGELLSKVIPKAPLLALVGLDTLSTDPAVIERFQQDPLTYKGGMRIGLGNGMNVKAKELRGKLDRVKLPVLILHGEDDRLVSISGSVLFNEQAASADKTYISYPGLRHEILNEPEHDAILKVIIQWLDARLPQ